MRSASIGQSGGPTSKGRGAQGTALPGAHRPRSARHGASFVTNFDRCLIREIRSTDDIGVDGGSRVERGRVYGVPGGETVRGADAHGGGRSPAAGSPTCGTARHCGSRRLGRWHRSLTPADRASGIKVTGFQRSRSVNSYPKSSPINHRSFLAHHRCVCVARRGLARVGVIDTEARNPSSRPTSSGHSADPEPHSRSLSFRRFVCRAPSAGSSGTAGWISRRACTPAWCRMPTPPGPSGGRICSGEQRIGLGAHRPNHPPAAPAPGVADSPLCRPSLNPIC